MVLFVFQNSMKRTLIIVAVVLVLIGIGLGIYFMFFSSSPNVTVAPEGSLPTVGQNVPTTSGTDATTPSTTINSPTVVTSRLVKISAGPVVPGEVVINKKVATASSTPETVVNFIERESGNVFSYLVQTKTLTRTSNKTIPGIQSASWLPDGSMAFVRYLSGTDFSTINTYGLPSSGTGGFFLAQGLADIAVSATGILTLTSGVNGSTASLSRLDGTRSTTVFSTPLSALRVSFAGKSYLAVTKASATLSGDAFVVDASGRFSRIAGPHSGLVALASPSGKWVLVSYTLNSVVAMKLVNVATGETLVLPIATIADKCVWTTDELTVYCGVPVNPPSATYPDEWYQSVVHFTDRMWKIQVESRYAQLVLDFSKETKDSLDAESLATNTTNTVLVFVNKNDGALWSYSL